MIQYYNQFFEKGQQVINFNFYNLGLSADDPVYTLINILEDFDFSSCWLDTQTREEKAITLFIDGTKIEANEIDIHLYGEEL